MLLDKHHLPFGSDATRIVVARKWMSWMLSPQEVS